MFFGAVSLGFCGAGAGGFCWAAADGSWFARSAKPTTKPTKETRKSIDSSRRFIVHLTDSYGLLAQAEDLRRELQECLSQLGLVHRPDERPLRLQRVVYAARLGCTGIVLDRRIEGVAIGVIGDSLQKGVIRHITGIASQTDDKHRRRKISIRASFISGTDRCIERGVVVVLPFVRGCREGNVVPSHGDGLVGVDGGMQFVSIHILGRHPTEV